MKKIYIAAGVWNLIAALIHTILGQIKLINPFLDIEFADILKAILLSCWHMVTAILFLTSIVFFIIGWRPDTYASNQLSCIIGVYYSLATLAFATVSIYYGLFLFQVPLLLVIAILGFIGARSPRVSQEFR
ncbi:MAG: hypothetical protein R3F48_09965 [Candidatus Zixiibacteriota bacterium]